MDSDSLGPPGQPFLQDISTYWPQVGDPVKFVLRYGGAIQRYMAAILRDSEEAEDVCQEFLLRVFERGFSPAQVARGRFRDYLKAAVRNAVMTQLRRRHPEVRGSEQLDQFAAPDDLSREADEVWAQEWRKVLLERVWQSLELYEQQHPDSHYYTVLRLLADHPEADSAALAAKVSQRTGKPYRAEAFRKQVSRARRCFAECIVREVRQSLHAPTADDVDEELNELHLMKYVRDYLPPDWRESGLFEG